MDAGKCCLDEMPSMKQIFIIEKRKSRTSANRQKELIDRPAIILS